MNPVTLEINGKAVSSREGLTVLEAASDAGITIPTLCYHEALTPYGGCRLCTVEVTNRGRSRLVTACTYPVEEGLVVTTDSPAVHRIRMMIVELLLARCPNVPMLQSLAKDYGIEKPRLKKIKDDDCILCGLCVRMCAERMGANAISFVGRGVDRGIDTPFHVQSAVCRTCGACAFICPTGAIKLEDISKNTPIPITSEFDMGLGGRAPVYIPYPQAIPNVPVIDKNNCIHFLTGECEVCQSVCKVGAINYEQQDEDIEIDVGSIILAPGYEPFDATIKPQYGYGQMPNVVTSIQFERILSASGPFQGQVLQPSDGKHPVKIAWIQCVGSRDETCGRDYCSSVCCMYAIKQSIIAKEHASEIEPTIFFMDIRAHGKGFERYYERAQKEHGVRFIRTRVPRILEEEDGSLLVRYADDTSVSEERFDMVVLSVGMVPSASTKDLADKLAVSLDRFGFCKTEEFKPNITSRPGIYVAGAFDSPMDIPESVMHASSAAYLASRGIADARGTLVTDKEYPPEIDISDQEPRVGVFVCRCGTNIARVIDVPGVAEYARGLPYVVYAEEKLYACSTDTQTRLVETIKENNLNRIVIASCSPRTHEPLFQDTIREAGLNRFLFEMANIRDQCSWVHATHKTEANEKAIDLVRMAVARAVKLEPLRESTAPIKRNAVVIGGGIAGMTAALGIASQGFEAVLIERESELGGNLRHLHYTLEGSDPQALLSSLVKQIEEEPNIRVYTGAEIKDFSGYIGNYTTTISTAEGSTEEIEHGVVILATGGVEYRPVEYLGDQSDRVLTQRDLEEKIANGEADVENLKSVVMIQCVGSREEDHMYCSRICCGEAVKNAIKLKDQNPEIEVYVLYRDIRTYGMNELKYQEARGKGVTFIRFDVDRKPEVKEENGKLSVKVFDPVIGADILLEPDLIALSSAIRPQFDAAKFSSKLKLPLTQDGFYMEAHLKLRPLDFVNEGMYVCGIAHAPKSLSESISQARGAVSRAMTVLSKSHIIVGGVVSEVDEGRCVACLTCVRSCPYNVPIINEKGVAYIEPAACQGCGICASACPRKAIKLRHYSDEQIIAKTAVLC